ncbi:unnamed protein product [Caenorhabditis angaria]|uniref:Uncharacterized protein n=1 Tax=Caenorhabditis angaria TaxID=860376 RepID=A0A9P1MXZ2_9PELO|nr:unnamed protein product [Caenorhabditis angaria]
MNDFLDCQAIFVMLRFMVQLSSDFLVIISSVFYICIFISVRKFINLPSTVFKTRPEKIYDRVFEIDSVTTPVISQLAYIFCNKTHLEYVMKMNFGKLRTWLIVCCGASSNSVNYEQEVENLGVASGTTQRQSQI